MPQTRRSTAGMAAQFPKWDLHNPAQFKQVVQNISNVYHATPEHIRAAARPWYTQVNEAVARGVRGTSMTPRQGAGLVAAVSPAMDFEARNIHAFKDFGNLRQRDWDTIARSARGEAGNTYIDPRTGRTKIRRSGEAESLLKGTSLAHTSDRFLMEGYRIMRGEDFADVMPRISSPKRNAFGEAIDDPEGERHKALGQRMHVPIDYRAYDIGMNQMIPTQFTGRGIDKANLPSGKTTRYEHFENAYRSASASVGEDPDIAHQMQAITWVGAKDIETAGYTKSGKRRQKGATRVGQPYVA